MGIRISGMGPRAAIAALLLGAGAQAQAQALPCAAEGDELVLHEWSGVAPSAAGGLNAAQTREALPALDCAYDALDVVVSWDNVIEDLDLDVVDERQFVVASSGKFNAEEDGTGPAFEAATVGSPVGAYTAVVKSYTNYDTAFTASATARCTTAGGCFAPVTTQPSFEEETRVVVAVIDSAINLYHSFYYAGGEGYPNSAPQGLSDDMLVELGVPPENVFELTRTGTLAERIAADQERVWDKIERGQRYYFVGTNVVAQSFAGNDDDGNPHPLLVPTTDKSPHGVGTSSAVLKANPEAVILFLETEGALANDASHVAAFRDPAVDIISTSYGIGAAGVFPPELWSFHQSFKSVVYDGKLHFSSGGNAPGFTPGRAGAGPWWSIGVSGSEEDTSNGRTTVSGNLPDFISDFTQDLARCMDCVTGLAPYGGTSFSTPRAAGVAGIKKVDNVPYMVLADDSVGEFDLTNWIIRRSLEEAAYVPTVDDYDPVAAVLDDLGAQPINPVAPWLQTGWGDLTAAPTRGVVNAALTHLGLAASPRVKPQDFCQFQTTLVQERKLYWDTLSPLVPAVGLGDRSEPLDDDPFIYCDSGLPAPYPAANDPGGQTYDPAGDFDGDGVSNADDECPEDPMNDCAPDTDIDDDGIDDADDNCPTVPNADQRDTGDDGVGDACETGPTSDAPPTGGRNEVARYEGPGATVVTPVVGLGAGSGSDGFATSEYRYQLPGAFEYDLIEFTLSATQGTQHSMRIYGPDGNLVAMEGPDFFAGEFGSEPLSDGELHVSLATPPQGLYLIQIQEQLGAANQPFTVTVHVTCPETGCVLVDTDGDGVPDVNDAFPNDPTETLDSDQDGVGDNADPCPEDPADECGATNGAAPGDVFVVISHLVGEDGLTVAFDASASYKCASACESELNHQPLESPEFTFFFRDDTTGDVNAATFDADGDGLITHRYGAAGTFRPDVVVRDANGNAAAGSTEVTTTVTVDAGERPVENAARLVVDYDRANPVVPLEVVFDATLTTVAEGFTITGYTFDFDDGTVIQTDNAIVQHVYVTAGTYEPEVTVEFTDGDGAQQFSSAKSQAVQASASGTNDVPSSRSGGGSGALGGWLLLSLMASGLLRRRMRPAV